MLESDWLASTDAGPMLTYLAYGGGDPFVSDQGPRVEVTTDRKLRLFAHACASICNCPGIRADHWERYVTNGLYGWGDGPCKVTREIAADLVRHIFGNPFRPLWSVQCENCKGKGLVLTPCGSHKGGHFLPCEACGGILATEKTTKPGRGWQPVGDRPSIPTVVIELAKAMSAGEACDYALHDAMLDASLPEVMTEHFVPDHVVEVKNGLATDQGWQYEHHPKGCWVIDAILNKE